jgi:hypothetical protein
VSINNINWTISDYEYTDPTHYRFYRIISHATQDVTYVFSVHPENSQDDFDKILSTFKFTNTITPAPTPIPTISGKLDDYAMCLKNKGAILYGTFWSPHTDEQKRRLGYSYKYLPYVECSTPDGMGQLKICKDKNIQTYPTWIFSDGSRLSGNFDTEQLGIKTSCELPEGV